MYDRAQDSNTERARMVSSCSLYILSLVPLHGSIIPYFKDLNAFDEERETHL